MPEPCGRYHLEQEGPTVHFHSGVDGSIFIPASEDNTFFHSNEDYCVDYFYMQDNFDPSADVLKVNIFTFSLFDIFGTVWGMSKIFFFSG